MSNYIIIAIGIVMLVASVATARPLRSGIASTAVSAYVWGLRISIGVVLVQLCSGMIVRRLWVNAYGIVFDILAICLLSTVIIGIVAIIRTHRLYFSVASLFVATVLLVGEFLGR